MAWKVFMFPVSSKFERVNVVPRPDWNQFPTYGLTPLPIPDIEPKA